MALGLGLGLCAGRDSGEPLTPTWPSEPFNVVAELTDEGILVSWSKPASHGSPILSYTATSTPGSVEDSGSELFLLFPYDEFDAETEYTFSVYATNAIGDGPSAESNPATTPAAAGTVWDAASKAANITLSNGNLTAATLDDSSTEGAKSLPSRNAGKRALKFTVTYASGDATNYECVSGLVIDTFDTSTTDPSRFGFCTAGDGYILKMDGMGGSTFTDLGLPVASGGWFALLIDETAGKGWLKTADGSGAGDPEAGTGEHFTFDPGTAFTAGCTLWSIDTVTPTSVTLDPTYSSGTFAAWDS